MSFFRFFGEFRLVIPMWRVDFLGGMEIGAVFLGMMGWVGRCQVRACLSWC